MSTYETRIENVENSNVAIGDHAKAIWRGDHDDIAETLRELRDIASKYTDATAREVQDLAQAASTEISADRPRKEVFQRLADATRKMIARIGSSVIEAGALASAVDKISEVIHHL